jgi:hypothetical protein
MFPKITMEKKLFKPMQVDNFKIMIVEVIEETIIIKKQINFSVKVQLNSNLILLPDENA